MAVILMIRISAISVLSFLLRMSESALRSEFIGMSNLQEGEADAVWPHALIISAGGIRNLGNCRNVFALTLCSAGWQNGGTVSPSLCHTSAMPYESELKSVLEAIEEPCLLLREDRTVVHANRSACQEFTMGPVAGRRCYELFFHRNRPCGECPLDRAAVSGRLAQCLRREPVPGGERFIELFVSPVTSSDGNARFYLEKAVTRRRSLHDADGIVAKSVAVKRVLRKLERLTVLDLPVLFVGPSGAGKSHFARFLHENSRRAFHALIRVECAALTPQAFENEILGVPDAAGVRRGGLAEDPGATLYFSDVADLTPEVQAQLQMLLEHHCVRELGTGRKHVVDCRVFCGTSSDLMERVRKGQFRRGLRDRLFVAEVLIPSLSERAEDLPELASLVLRRLGCRFEIPEATLEHLIRRRWSGNVRELECLLTRAVVFSDGPELVVDEPESGSAAREEPVHGGAERLWRRPDELFAYAEDWKGTKRELARRLGCSERTLYRALKRGPSSKTKTERNQG